MPDGKKVEINWTEIFKKLEQWRKKLGSEEEPAVTEVAGYGHEPERPWVILVSTIISLRTKDDVTIKASKALLEKAPDPASLLRIGQKETERLIYPAGFYKTKSASLKKIAEIVLDQYNGKVPDSMDNLLALPGVGRKTANLVLVEAYNQYGICVDIHVHRISNRFGWARTSTPEKTEMTLREILPRRYWKRINYLLVLYGQRVCRPISPFCSRCVIAEHCEKNNVEKSR